MPEGLVNNKNLGTLYF